jgi:serine phosphatase RsbU (regulator of sigma subunit)
MNGTRHKVANFRGAAGGWTDEGSTAAAGWPAVAARNRRTVAEMAARLRAMEEQRAVLLEANRSLNEALSNAAQLQRKLSAPREIRHGRFEIASEIFAASHLSGDFYDVQEDDGHLTFAVGDIAGKGLVAGLWFTYLVGLVRLRAESSKDPSSVAAAVNRDLSRLCEMPPTVALFVARLNLASGEMVYTNAGQPSAVLIRTGGTVEFLSAGGPILGAVPGADFESRRTTLTAGDTLIVASDGIHECRNGADEEFGAARLVEAALATRGLPAVAALFSILGAAQDFSGGRAQCDELTLMAIHHR